LPVATGYFALQMEDHGVGIIRGLEAARGRLALIEGEARIDDVLTYALFPQVGLHFLENRNNPAAFEPVPTGRESGLVTTDSGEEVYTVNVEGQDYTVTVTSGGDITGLAAVGGATEGGAAMSPSGEGTPVKAPLAGTISSVQVKPGQAVKEGDTLLVLEAMKMESEVSAAKAGTVTAINVQAGDSVAVGDILLIIA
jgi:oxaloacetate decarboxylase alpha subunit